MESLLTPVISTVRELAVVSNPYPDRELAELSVFSTSLEMGGGLVISTVREETGLLAEV